MALVKYPCALRLRRLAQNRCRGSSVRHFSCKLNVHTKWLLWNVHVPFDRAGLSKTRYFSYRNLTKRLLRGSSYRDLAKRPLMEILPRDTFQRSCQQSSCRDLVHRSCQETSYGDLVQRPGDESIGLPQTSFLDTLNSLNRDLPLRSLTKIFCGDLL